MTVFEGTATLSGHLDYFEDQGAYYVYHNLFGYIMQMSRDIIDLLEFFRGAPKTEAEAIEGYAQHFGADLLDDFLRVLLQQGCLVPEGRSEEEVALGFVPIRGRWIIYEEPKRGNVVLYRAQKEVNAVEEIELDVWDSAFWRKIDGEKNLQELVDELREHPDSPSVGIEQKALATLSSLTHSSAQFLKLSARPMSAFADDKNRIPPYLVSTMPYRRVTEEIRGESAINVGLNAESSPIPEEALESDRQETTLNELFRVPHDALDGRSYGGALADRLIAIAALDVHPRILELGAESSTLAVGVLDRIKAVVPDLFGKLAYTAVTSDESAAQSIKEAAAAAGHTIEVLVGAADGLGDIEGLGDSYGAIFSNEHIANLEVALVSKIPAADLMDEDDEDAPGNGKGKDMYLGEGDSVNLIFKHSLTFHDLDGEFFLNTGAIHCIEQSVTRLGSGGALILIEFGDLFAYPQPAGEEGREQFSVHFRTLQKVGKSVGMETEFDWVLARFGFDVHREMLATNKGSFRALRRLLEKRGVTLENIATSKDDFRAMLKDKIRLDELGGVVFESLNDRVMGLVPSSVKILEMVKPVVTEIEV